MAEFKIVNVRGTEVPESAELFSVIATAEVVLSEENDR